MKFSLFENVKSQKGIWCTLEQWMKYSASKRVKQICDAISQLSPDDHEAIGELKKGLPIVTWQAYFEGRRLNEQAQPSGLCILDVDKVDDPYKLWCSIIARREELGILLAHKTPSGHGLRLVFLCRKEFSTLDECQRWMAKEIGVEHDAACKDFARSSYMVPDSYVYYFDGKLFSTEPEVVYDVKGNGERVTVKDDDIEPETTEHAETVEPPQTYPADYQGILFTAILRKYWEMYNNGKEPERSNRNTLTFEVASCMRHICDHNADWLCQVIPCYDGFSEKEKRATIESALKQKNEGMPMRLRKVLEALNTPAATTDDTDDELSLNSQLSTQNSNLPPLPPLFRQLAKIAPLDFIIPTILCILPLLGTLASKLRARYLDRSLHSPSFQVSLEAPQASGKSFIARMARLLLAPIIERDETERKREQEYNEKVAELKVTGMKVTPENRDELLGQRPKGIIRNVPATISITKMLMRMENACGLHLVAVCEEIDTVTKAFKRAISSYSDALRVSFDNGPYGQDYASENSYSGIIPLYYNTLFSGTPKAMRRFYPDVEDGLVSRVLFVTLPDQFGKPMPVWGELSDKDRKEVEEQIRRLNEVSIVGEVVQPDHVMNLDFLNRAMELWLKEQQAEAVRTQNRTLDIFCRRAAVVGFRAGMLAWFLYGEKDTRTVRKNTVLFATWVAGQMLTQHLLRFQIEGTGSNTSHWEEAYRMLPDEFTREDLQRVCIHLGKNTPIKNVIYNWRLLGNIEITETVVAQNGKHQAMKFKKKQ